MLKGWIATAGVVALCCLAAAGGRLVEDDGWRGSRPSVVHVRAGALLVADTKLARGEFGALRGEVGALLGMVAAAMVRRGMACGEIDRVLCAEIDRAFAGSVSFVS